MIDGILIVDKEVGITSYDVIRKLKKILDKKQKIGHGGTLDPFASGLLIILLGKATKLMNTIHTYEKVYEVEAQFGFCTDTQDMEGNILKRDTKRVIPTREEMELVIEKHFIGDISQIPPIYSAKKVKGKKAYELAREGKQIVLSPTKVFVSQFEVYEYEYPVFKCKIKCLAGTYVRTLVHDFGIKLGTYATTQQLRRVSIGNFNVHESLSSKEIILKNTKNILRRVINI